MQLPNTKRYAILAAICIGGTFFACKKKDSTATIPVTPTAADFKVKKVLDYTDSAFVLSLPTAFTPNGDGVNDVYAPIATHLTDTHFQLTVSTLSGVVVYTTNDCTSGWNGHNTSGALMTDYKYNVAISFSTAKGKNVDTSTYLYLVPTNPSLHCATFMIADTGSYIFPDQIDVLTGYKAYNTNEVVCH